MSAYKHVLICVLEVWLSVLVHRSIYVYGRSSLIGYVRSQNRQAGALFSFQLLPN